MNLDDDQGDCSWRHPSDEMVRNLLYLKIFKSNRQNSYYFKLNSDSKAIQMQYYPNSTNLKFNFVSHSMHIYWVHLLELVSPTL